MNTTYIDLHCDTLFEGVSRGSRDLFQSRDTMVDVERLRAADVTAQFFAIFFPAAEKLQERLGLGDREYYERARQLLLDTIAAHPGELALAGGWEELRKNRERGAVSAVLTLEDGRLAEGRLENLQRLYEEGIRLITLTWNSENCFGSPNSRDPKIMEKGLTGFGKEALEEMNRLGILVDVSHLSDGGFWDVVQVSRKPFLASHSNCRELCRHPRNLTDEMIRALAEKGGVIGVNFFPLFLDDALAGETGGSSGEARERIRGTRELLARHLRHLIDVGGRECTAIGTDFDGIFGELEVSDPTEMETLFAYLAQHGFTQEEIEGLAYRNVTRVMKDVWNG